jgi:hypothetical protein
MQTVGPGGFPNATDAEPSGPALAYSRWQAFRR